MAPPRVWIPATSGRLSHPAPAATGLQRVGGKIEDRRRSAATASAMERPPQTHSAAMLQALESLSERQRSQLRLTVVGDGPLRARLEVSARRLLPGRVEFLGWRPRDQLPAIYAGSQVLVLPSLMEGMPNVVLEAMAAGLPVIATRVGGCPELVADGLGGLLVEPGSAAALAAALSTALDQRERLPEWGAASRSRVAAFSWDSVAERYLALAETAAGRRRRSTPASLAAD